MSWHFNEVRKSRVAMLAGFTVPNVVEWETVCLAAAIGGEINDRVLWKVVEGTHAGMTERWIECVLLDFINNGWCTETEAEGSLYYDCPLEFLAMAPERNPAWRAKVRAFAERGVPYDKEPPLLFEHATYKL